MPSAKYPKVQWRTPSGEKPGLEIDYGWQEAVERDSKRPRRSISQDQIDVFVAWRGNSERYHRAGAQDARMFAEAWSTISVLLQKMHAVVYQQSSRKYGEALELELQQSVPDLHARESLWRLAQKELPTETEPT